MCDRPYLVTTCTFKGKDYIVKMNIVNRHTLELRVSDKITSEEWHCSYDATYIESLTHKTGNFKQFDIFVTMLKSGLLKTTDSVILDLLTFDDLENLRSRRVAGRNFVPQASHLLPFNSNNRRYFILTYTVEFDRIHYPLPLEYCGPPDPQILQGSIKRLEQEVANLQEQLARSESNNRGEVIEQISALEKRLVDVTTENQILLNENQTLTEEVNRLTRLAFGKQTSRKQIDILKYTVQTLEEKVKCERASLLNLVKQLRQDKTHLLIQLEEAQKIVKYLRNQTQFVREMPQPNFLLKQTREMSPQPRLRNTSSFNNNVCQEVNRKLLKVGRSDGMLGRNFGYNITSRNLRGHSSDSSIENDKVKSRIKKNTNITAAPSRYRSSSGNSQKSGHSKHSPIRNNLQVGKERSRSSCSCSSDKHARRKSHKSRRELKTGMSDLEERVQALQMVLRNGMSLT